MYGTGIRLNHHHFGVQGWYSCRRPSALDISDWIISNHTAVIRRARDMQSVTEKFNPGLFITDEGRYKIA